MVTSMNVAATPIADDGSITITEPRLGNVRPVYPGSIRAVGDEVMGELAAALRLLGWPDRKVTVTVTPTDAMTVDVLVVLDRWWVSRGLRARLRQLAAVAGRMQAGAGVTVHVDVRLRWSLRMRR
jgi:hypothetical protein